MSLSVGIVGLPNVGKSTLFNALLKKQQAYAANFPFATIEPNVGIVPVPDGRLSKLAETIYIDSGSTGLRAADAVGMTGVRPPEVPATVEFVDIAGLIAGAHKGEGLGNKFLSHIREVSAILHVVRLFTDEDVVRVGSPPSPEATEGQAKSDFETIKTELELADLETVDRATAKAKAGKENIIENLPLLAKKPFLVCLNVSEDQLKNAGELEEKYAQEFGLQKDQIVAICAKTESELAALDEADQKAYLSDLGIEESGLERLIKKAFSTLGLITFLTAGEKEVRAWTIKDGMKAPEAAGVIHTDFEKKFIKADVVNFNDFINPGGLASPERSGGGWKNCRENGKVRSEGRDYTVKDGDVIEFKIGA